MHRVAYALGSALATSAVLIATALASGSSCERSLTTPAWARPLSGVRPYYVARDYGSSRGLTCDLRVYTTNRAAFAGRANFRPGDTTATVCVIRRVGP
jgi:hypothetical protein